MGPKALFQLLRLLYIYIHTYIHTVTSIKLEAGLRPNSAGIPYTLLLRIEAIGFPTFGLLLYVYIYIYIYICIGLRVWRWGLGFRLGIYFLDPPGGLGTLEHLKTVLEPLLPTLVFVKP